MYSINPLSLKKSFFSEECEQVLKSKFDKFASDFFTGYLSSIYVSETFATIAYPILQKRFHDGFYTHKIGSLTEKELKDIDKYFSKMIEDEDIHCGLLKNLLDRYQVKIPIDAIKQLDQYSAVELATDDVFRSLALFFIGECYLWTGFYIIYKETEDQYLKELFHTFLVDETRHNQSIRKIFKIIKEKINFDAEYYDLIVAKKKYFGLEFIREIHRLPGTGTKQDIWWEQLIFNNKLQQKFNEIFIKKCCQGLAIFVPDVDYANYKNSINQC